MGNGPQSLWKLLARQYERSMVLITLLRLPWPLRKVALQRLLTFWFENSKLWELVLEKNELYPGCL